MENYADFEDFNPENEYSGGGELADYTTAFDITSDASNTVDVQSGGNDWGLVQGSRGNYGTVDNALYQNENNFQLFNKTDSYMEPSEMRGMPVLDDFGISGLDPMESDYASVSGGYKKKPKMKSKKKPKKKSKKVSKKRRDSVNKIKNFFDDLF
jgi:hypothetical protein